MIVIEAWMTCRAGTEEEFATNARELALATRTEPDYQVYNCSRDVVNPSRFVFVEHWEDMEAFGRHLATDHYQAFAAKAPAWIEARDVRIHEVSSTTQR